MNLFAVTGIAIGTTATFMMILSVVKAERKKVHYLWALFCFSVAIWGFGAFKIATADNPSDAELWWRVTHIGIVFMPSLLLHFVYKFLNIKNVYLVVLSYIASVIFLAANLTKSLFIVNTRLVFNQFYYDSPPGPLYHFFVAFFFCAVSWCLIRLWRSKDAMPPRKKKQINFLLFSFISGFIGGGLSFLPVYGIDVYPVLNFAVAFGLIVTTYAMIRHDFLEIKTFTAQTFTIFTLLVIFIEILFSRSTTEVVLRSIFFIVILISAFFVIRNIKKEVILLEKLKMQTIQLRESRDRVEAEKERLNEIMEIKDDFLRIIHHQINTPLAVAKSAVSLIGEAAVDTKKALYITRQGLNRLSETIADFWAAYELEGKRIQMLPSPTDVVAVAKELISHKKYYPPVVDRHLNLSITVPDGYDIPQAFCDRKGIAHVLSNLLDNAINYTPRGQISIEFSLNQETFPDMLVITVQDTGVGISKEDQKVLFQKFSRGDKAGLISPDGSGLGLYIARKIMDGNGGKVLLEKSVEGQGSTFIMTLPIYNPALHTYEEEVTPPAQGDDSYEIYERRNRLFASQQEDLQSKKRILLVEDESNLVELYRIFLESRGYAVSVTQSIEDAIDLIRDYHVDVILLDVILPTKQDGRINTIAEQGYSFLREVKKHEALRDIPVIMFTSLNTEKDRAKAKSLGAAGYIFKGNAEPHDVADAIADVLEEAKDDLGARN